MPLASLKPLAVTGNVAADIRSDLDQGPMPLTPGSIVPQFNPEAAFNDLLQKIYDKIKAEGETIIADMQKAQVIASTKLPDGSVADQPSSNCLSALIPIIQLIVDNQIVLPGVTPAPGSASTTPDGLVTAFVKIRVVVNALQSPSVQSGCSWLQQTIKQAGTQGLATLLGGILGVTKLAGVVGLA